jgi:predicted transcriptional regulator
VSELSSILSDLGVSQAELATALGITQAAISYKLSGQRQWRLQEAFTVVAYLRLKYNADVTLDDLFSQPFTQEQEPVEATAHG